MREGGIEKMRSRKEDAKHAVFYASSICLIPSVGSAARGRDLDAVHGANYLGT